MSMGWTQEQVAYTESKDPNQCEENIFTLIKYLLDKSPKDEEYAGQHPGLNSSQTLSLGSVGGDIVEDVHQHQKKCH
jgi:hypothetical protein